MLVAPVSRSAIVNGKCLGGATVATLQGIIILALAGAAHVPYDPILFLTVIGELLLLSFTLTAFGVMMAGGWEVPVGLSLGIVALMGEVPLGIAIAEFRRTE